MVNNNKNNQSLFPIPQPPIPDTSTTYQKAFTIVELLVVIVVIAILAAISFVAYNGVSQRATAAVLQSDLAQSSKKLKLYQAEYGYYPVIDSGTLCPVAPSAIDSRYCLKSSSGNTLAYQYIDEQNFSLSATKNDVVYAVTNNTAPTLVSLSSSPQNLSMVLNNSSQATLSWSAPSDNGGSSISGYKIYRGTSSGSETWLANTSSVLTYVDSSLLGSTSYYYRITAINAKGESAYSNEVNGTTGFGGVDSYTKLVLHGDSIADNNVVPKSVNNSSTPVTSSSAQSKFGGKSLYFGGSSFLTIPYYSDFELNNSGSPKDFAIDFWLYNAGGNTDVGLFGGAPEGNWTDYPTIDFFQDYTSGSGAIVVELVDGYSSYTYNYGVPYSLGQNTWKHIAVTRQSGVQRYFVNGVIQLTDSSHTMAIGRIGGSQGLYIGRRGSNIYPYYLNGYIDELRISVGASRWTSNFTPPTQAYSN